MAVVFIVISNSTACKNEDSYIPEISTSIETIDLKGTDETITVTINSDCDWYIWSSAKWITVSPISGTKGTSDINITALANNLSSVRSDHIEICRKRDSCGIARITINQSSTPQWQDYPVNTNDDVIDWANREKIILTGDVNGSHIREIRNLCGATSNDESWINNTEPTLKVLDLKDASIVSGGDYYLCCTHNRLNYKAPTYFTSTDEVYIDEISGRDVLYNSFVVFIQCIDYYRPGINEYMFKDCNSLESITLPKNVKSVWSNAFHYCESLKEIHIPSSTPPKLEESKYDDSYNIFIKYTLYVPKGSLNAYRKADGWNKFQNIIEE
ncbi:leucine-rich repeat protein [Bacteroides caecigallinarum]|nr:leucine-rich repeat protein [Bacteroides caecigallinarum]